MDIRESVSKAPELELGDELRTIFKLQSSINYIPSFYNPKLNRKLANKFLQSLSKSYKLYIKTLKSRLTPELWDENIKTHYLYTFNLETATMLSNLISLMEASGISPDDMVNYYDNLLKNLKLEDYFFEGNLLQTGMSYARYNNINDCIYNNPEINLRPITVFNENVKDNFLQGGRVIDIVFGNILAENSWAITHNILQSSIILPNSVESSFEDYQNQVMECWLYFLKYMDLLGHNWDSMGRIYSVYYYIQTTKPKQIKDGK